MSGPLNFDDELLDLFDDDALDEHDFGEEPRPQLPSTSEQEEEQYRRLLHDWIRES
mgnify:CR=1 FL=1|jgi:hypothetical protein